jgi:hypothetical protein
MEVRVFRLLGLGFFGFLLIALWLYCIFDVISTDEVLVRNLPKMAWLLIVIVLPDIGSIAWLALGRPAFAGWRPGGAEARPSTRRVTGPEDRPDFPTRQAPTERDEQRLQAWEADMRRREEELRRRNQGEEPPPNA